MSEARELEIVHVDRHHAVAIRGSVLVRAVDGLRVELEHYDQLIELYESRLSKYPASGMLLIIHQGTPTPPADVRRYAAELMNRLERVTVVTGLAGLGVWSTLFRQTLYKMVGLLRHANFKVEGSVEAAAETLAHELIGVNSEQLLADYESLRAKMVAAG